MGYILTDSTLAKCPHGGKVRNTTRKAAASIGGYTVWVVDDSYAVDNCNSKCVNVVWSNASSNVYSSNSKALTSSSFGSCVDNHQYSLGPVMLVSYQKDSSDDQ